jgi:DNA primase
MDVLGLLEAKGFTLINVSGSEYKMQCINQSAHDDGEDTNWSLFVNVDKGVAFCQACGFRLSETAMTKWLIGDDLDDFQMAALSLKGALKRIQNAEEPFLAEAEEFTMMPPSTQWDRDYRGISKEFLQLMGARHCKVGRYENRIVLPINVNGRLKGFDSRALGDQKPKYLRSSGFDAKNEGLYPLDYVIKLRPNYVIVCEGLFDALNACALGFPAVCIFGLNVGMAKVALLLSTGASEVILFLDNDSAGITATSKIAAEIKDWITVSIADSSILVEGKDLGDLNKEEIQYCIDNRRRVK